MKGEKFPLSIEILNRGEGFAYETAISIVDYNSEICFDCNHIELGVIDTERTIRDLNCEVLRSEEIAFLLLKIKWKNFDGLSIEKSFEFEIESQKDSDWQALKLKQPYSLKPIETEDELIGRTEKLNTLIALCRNGDSCFVTGQKRVGKTSLVKILKEKIEKDSNLKILIPYVFIPLEPDPINTINTLAIRICQAIKLSDERLESIPLPTINNSFGAIYEFLLQVTYKIKDHKIAIIIDEFDQLPLELYRRGDIGDSLFNAFKNLSTESKFSFILVGGEKMQFIKNVQAIHLNLFKSISLDYFDAENSWSDFEELVRYPVKNDFDIDNSAIRYVYSYTLGHPYFTKKICQEMYTICVNNHDNHVTAEEMKKAVAQAISTSDVNDFAHFWDDGIMEKGDKQEEISVMRRKTFLTIMEVSNKTLTNGALMDEIEAHSLRVEDFNKLLDEFIIREIVQKNNDILSFRVKFFSEWLQKYGYKKIFTNPADEKAISERKKIEEQSKVTSEEVMELIKLWAPYNGKEITSDKIRAWLNQFGTDPIVQRLMFKILQNVLFIDNNLIRVYCREIYKAVLRKLVQQGLERFIDPSRRKRGDIIVSYLEDSFAKSGSEYAKIFADENGLYADLAISRNKLREYLSSDSEAKVLVFLDDFAGTGDSICKNLRNIYFELKEILQRKNLIIFLGVICGYDKAKKAIQTFIEENGLKTEVFFSKILDESDHCFSEYSKVFPLVTERNHAKSICLQIGEKLIINNPLGYGNTQSLVVFPNACPNNNLPILWKETDSWMPLFKRQ